MILDKYNWNISQAAKALHIDRVTLYNKIKKYNLKQE
ncbi:MAG: helix-turn-helix domain-containing protein [Bacteroidales bacterium]